MLQNKLSFHQSSVSLEIIGVPDYSNNENKDHISREIIIYLFNVLGLDESTIELGIKLSTKNNTPLPILLWSYGMLTIEELDKLYSFLFQKMDS